MDNYEIETRIAKQIENGFTYHAPKNDQQERYVMLRKEAMNLAYTIAKNTPPSREQAIALTKLEECIFAANAAIARNE